MAGKNCRKTPCRNCGELLNEDDNFCFNCGNKSTKRCSCGQAVTSSFKFCPKCGSPQTHSMQSSPQPTDRQTLLSDVKERLLSLQAKSKKREMSTDASVKKPKIGKKELIIHGGVKYKDCANSYTLVHRKYGGGIQKLHIDRNASYEKCIESICEAFHLSKTSDMFLMDNSNRKIDPDGFTVGTYVKSYAYLGATRLYLAVETLEKSSSSDDLFDLLPPNLTPQKDVEVLHGKRKAEETPGSVGGSSTDNESGGLLAIAQTEIQKNELEIVKASTCTLSLSSVSQDDLTMDKAQNTIQKSVTEKRCDKQDELSLSKPGYTPLYFNNVKVRYFVDKKFQSGVDLDIVESHWGQFVLVSDELLDEFFEMRNSVDFQHMFYLDIPLLYFLKISEFNTINLDPVSPNIIKLDETVSDSFKAWYSEVKSSIE